MIECNKKCDSCAFGYLISSEDVDGNMRYTCLNTMNDEYLKEIIVHKEKEKRFLLWNL